MSASSAMRFALVAVAFASLVQVMPQTTNTPPSAPAIVADGSCNPSKLIPGGCLIMAGTDINMEFHYRLIGTEKIQITLRGKCTGYVSIAFKEAGAKMNPSDGVFGWVDDDTAAAVIAPYFVDSYVSIGDADKDASYTLTDTEGEQSADGYTTVSFTRDLKVGRFPIDPNSAHFNVAYSNADYTALHSPEAAQQWEANLLSGGATIIKDDRDKFWVTHGIFAICAWVVFVPHAVFFATFKGKWNTVFTTPGMWFHLHRLLQLAAVLLHIVVMILPKAKFGTYKDDGIRQLHNIVAWLITGLLAIQWFLALFFRPPGGAPKRALWNTVHFWTARVLMLLAFLNVSDGVYLYYRKKLVDPLVSTGGWVGILVAGFATVIVHMVIMVIRPAPAPKNPTDVAVVAASEQEETPAANGTDLKAKHSNSTA